MYQETLKEHIGRSAKTWTELPVVSLRVGDCVNLCGHTYMIHIADNNEVVLGPVRGEGKYELSVTLNSP